MKVDRNIQIQSLIYEVRDRFERSQFARTAEKWAPKTRMQLKDSLAKPERLIR